MLGFFVLDHDPPRYAGPALLAMAVALAILLRGRAVGRALAVAAIAVSCGFASAQWATDRAAPPLNLPTRATLVTGTVSGIEMLPGGRRLTLAGAHLDGGPVLPRTLHIRLRATDDAPLATGDAVQVRSVLRPPAPPAYPGAWDLQRDAYFSGLGGSGTALGKVERTVPAATPPASGPGRLVAGRTRGGRGAVHGRAARRRRHHRRRAVHRARHRHPGGGPRRLPRLRPGAPAGGGRACISASSWAW